MCVYIAHQQVADWTQDNNVRFCLTTGQQNDFVINVYVHFLPPLCRIKFYFYFTNGRYIECLSLTYATDKGTK